MNAERPELWNIGMVQYTPSPAATASSGTHDQNWYITAHGVITALDGPVVPDVNMSEWMSRYSGPGHAVSVDTSRSGGEEVVGVDDHDSLQLGHVGLHIRDPIDVLGGGQQGGGVGVVDGVGEHAPDVGGVERYLDHSQPAERQERAVGVERVRQQRGDVIARAHSERFDDCSPGAALGVELAIGERVPVDVLQRDRVRRLRCPARDRVRSQASSLEHCGMLYKTLWISS